MKPYLILILALAMTGCHKPVMHKNADYYGQVITNELSTEGITVSNLINFSTIPVCSPNTINVHGTNIIEGAITIASGNWDPSIIYMDTNNVLCVVFIDKTGIRKFKSIQAMEEFK